ncbi:MAG: CRTAC1 family protein [bacterium]|nr:CRTAC1 family protein [bacterium]
MSKSPTSEHGTARGPASAICILIAAVALACAGGPGSGQRDLAGSHEATGTEHMSELLREVAAESLKDNPFFGEAPIPDLVAKLAALPDGVPDLRRWLYNKLLGKHHLRLGRVETAIRHYLAAYREQREVFPGEIPRTEQVQLVFELAVAYMRLGENQNCVAHHTAESCLLPIRGSGVHTLREGSEGALRYLTEVLERTGPADWVAIKARWLINITYMTLGRYPDEVPAAFRIPPETYESEESFPRFREIASDLGLNSFDLAGGAIVEDFDDDGLLDILVSTSDPSGPMHYYRNDGDGGFTERTEAAGLRGLTGGLNMTHADYDNDGHTDVLVLRGAWCRAHGRHPNSLLRNLGDARFVDVTFAAGLGGEHFPTQTGAWGDYDNDGDLDLFIGNEYDRNVPARSQLFRNDGDGTFTEVTDRAGVRNERYAKGAVWGDFDGDRYPDLYVSNLSEKNRLYRNNRDGTFTDVAEAKGVTHPLASFPVWFWDFDNDGNLDIQVFAYGGPRTAPDVGAVAASYLGLEHPAELDHLYRGDGKGGFENVGPQRGLTRVTTPMGANFGDLDNDGYLDYYLGTGYPFFEGLMPNVMLRNRRGGRFVDVTTSGGFGHLQKGHGIAFADLDHDGDQDVFEQIGGMYPGDAFTNALFENPGFGNHWVKVDLVGVRSNRSAIGARVRVDIVEAGERRSIYRHVGTGGMFGGNPLRQEIGVGRATRVERLEIYWPTSDTTQTFVDLEVGQRIEITEGRDSYRVVPIEPFKLGRASSATARVD